MSDPYLLLSKFEPAATPANPLHSLIDLKGQCGLLRAWEQPSIFYDFLLRSMTGTHLPFVSWSVGFTGLRQHIYESFFLEYSLTHCSCLFPLVGRSRTTWSEHGCCRLASPHCSALLQGSLSWKQKEGREVPYLSKRHGHAAVGY